MFEELKRLFTTDAPPRDGLTGGDASLLDVLDLTADAKRLVAEIAPEWLRIGGYWYPRGGIPIDVFFQTGAPPEGIWLPDQGVQPYRGRG